MTPIEQAFAVALIIAMASATMGMVVWAVRTVPITTNKWER